MLTGVIPYEIDRSYHGWVLISCHWCAKCKQKRRDAPKPTALVGITSTFLLHCRLGADSDSAIWEIFHHHHRHASCLQENQRDDECVAYGRDVYKHWLFFGNLIGQIVHQPNRGRTVCGTLSVTLLLCFAHSDAQSPAAPHHHFLPVPRRGGKISIGTRKMGKTNTG